MNLLWEEAKRFVRSRRQVWGAEPGEPWGLSRPRRAGAVYTGSDRFSYWSRVTHTSCGYQVMGEGGERERGEVNGGVDCGIWGSRDYGGEGLGLVTALGCPSWDFKCCDEHRDQEKPRRGGWIWLTLPHHCSEKEVRVGTQTWRVLPTGLLPVTCSACFLNLELPAQFAEDSTTNH